ncbi:hypothetical protein KKH81_03435 [Patescibacteria group bacterium]|nr:hypothetical protein [Patescibacteria group bacterium]
MSVVDPGVFVVIEIDRGIEFLVNLGFRAFEPPPVKVEQITRLCEVDGCQVRIPLKLARLKPRPPLAEGTGVFFNFLNNTVAWFEGDERRLILRGEEKDLTVHRFFKEEIVF